MAKIVKKKPKKKKKETKQIKSVIEGKKANLNYKNIKWQRLSMRRQKENYFKMHRSK